MTTKRRPRISAQEARAVLREYPDADLSAFVIDDELGFDANVEAVAQARRTLGALYAKFAEKK